MKHIKKNFILLLFGIKIGLSQSNLTVYSSPLYTISNIEKKKNLKPKIKDINKSLFKNLKLILPCENIPVPKRTMRLPNAPRNYRNGVHRGIDFFANWGTPIRAVAEGIVIRSDLSYEEITPEFRENVLKSSSKVGKTPSDIFNNVLLGQSVFLDHGFDLIPGYRAISIYAHLSHINAEVKPGALIKSGQIFAKSGNSGVKESTLGSKSGAHLHWELIIQKDKDEIFLGKDIPNPELYELLFNIFN